MRFSAPDPVALAGGITDMRIKLAGAVQAGEALAIVDTAADLASMLTTSRMEAEAVQMLETHIHLAESLAPHEPAAWFWNAYATALQYCGRRSQAEPYFVKTIELATAGGWRRLEAMALHHWGRSLAEQQRFAEAKSRISQALTIRVELNDPRQESSRRALVELSALQKG
jgi:Flp pilus assembly protein TadD